MKVGGKFSEAHYLRQHTQTLLDLHGRDIDLQRDPEPADDGAGGVVEPAGPGPDVPVQRLYFGTYDDAQRLEFNPPHGEEIVDKHILIGMPNADIKKGDTFLIGTDTYVVSWMDPDRTWQTLAEVDYLGNQTG